MPLAYFFFFKIAVAILGLLWFHINFRIICSSSVKNLLSLIRSHLFIFAFISFALGGRSKKYCHSLCQRVFCLCFLLGVLWFPVLHLGL